MQCAVPLIRCNIELNAGTGRLRRAAGADCSDSGEAAGGSGGTAVAAAYAWGDRSAGAAAALAAARAAAMVDLPPPKLTAGDDMRVGAALLGAGAASDAGADDMRGDARSFPVRP